MSRADEQISAPTTAPETVLEGEVAAVEAHVIIFAAVACLL